MKLKHIIIVVAVVAILVSVTIGVRTHTPQSSQLQFNANGSTASYHTDLSDDRKLVGATHNIFIGKVIEQSGYYQQFAAKQIRYSVAVISNIKGNLSGVVTVNLNPGGSGLEKGDAYLFATRFDKGNNWYTLSAPEYDRVLITSDAGANDAQIKALAETNHRLKQLETAYPNEILFDVDLNNNWTYNSYASRHYDAQGSLIDDTVELHKAYMAAHPEAVTPSDIPTNSPSANDNALQQNTPAESASPAATQEASISPTDDLSPTLAPTNSSAVPSAS